MTIAKRKIHKFNFQSEGAHVALVDKAANKQEVLTMKAADREVTISTSMRTFLEKFFGLWSDDAAVLAGILGYSSTDPEGESLESYDDWIKSRIDSVQLLKGVEGFNTLPEGVVQKVEELQKQFGDALNPSQDSTSEEIIIKSGDTNMSDTKINTEELATLKAAALEVETLKGLVATMKADQEAKAKLDMTTVVKGYSFVSEADQQGLVDHLLNSEDSGVVLATLEKARDAIAAATIVETGIEAGEAEVATEETSLEKSTNLVADLLKSRQAK